jgi:hypothetical protein
MAEVEGDALYVHAHAERVHRGNTLLDLRESAYVEPSHHATVGLD